MKVQLWLRLRDSNQRAIINDCARTQFTYVSMWFSRKREQHQPFPEVNKVQVPASIFEDQRLEQTDFDSNELTLLLFTTVHRSEQGQV